MTTMRHFSPFSNDTWSLLSFLAVGLDGKSSVTITASRNGLTLRMGGTLMARGKDARELREDFDRRGRAAKQKLADLERRGVA